MKFIVEFEDSYSDVDSVIRKVFAVESETAEVVKSEVDDIYRKLNDGYEDDRVKTEIMWYGCRFETFAFITGGISVSITPIDEWVEKNSPAK